jgi:hypothetical protein
MSRSFANTLLYEGTLDTITSVNPILHNVVHTLFTPTVRIVEEDCGTLLGYSTPSSFRSEGYIETETGLSITPARRTTLLTDGRYNVNIRTISTCISNNGICRTCLASSRPRLAVPSIGSLYKVEPEIVLDILDVEVSLDGTDKVIKIPYDQTMYDTLYVFDNGLLVDQSEYSITDTKLIMSPSAVVGTKLVVRFLVKSNIEYYNWLCGTFAGSLLGVKQLSDNLLPVRKSTLLQNIPNEDISSLQSQLESLDIGADDVIMYLSNVKDPLEKAIYTCVLSSILLNT